MVENKSMSTHQESKTIILGIDPGTRITGYGVIAIHGPQIKPIDFGCIRPPVDLQTPARYLALFNGIEKLLDHYCPTAVAVETQFVYKNAQSAIKLGMARGVVLIAAAKRSIPIYEYAPKKAKLAVVGNGNASKEQVQRMIQLLLGLSSLPEPEDAADALALAVCHANSMNFKKQVIMYEYIKGTLIEATPLKTVLDVQGVGYCLLIPFNHFSKLPALGSIVTFYISFVVREDSHRLYGFLTQHERDLFENLLDVSGVGPKTSLSLVGHMEIHDLQTAISQGNTQLICKIPGIGKKTAERLVVDLRDKIKKGMNQSEDKQLLSTKTEKNEAIADAISALINLGYNNAQAQKAIKAALEKLPSEPELAKLITAALRCI